MESGNLFFLERGAWCLIGFVEWNEWYFGASFGRKWLILRAGPFGLSMGKREGFPI